MPDPVAASLLRQMTRRAFVSGWDARQEAACGPVLMAKWFRFRCSRGFVTTTKGLRRHAESRGTVMIVPSSQRAFAKR